MGPWWQPPHAGPKHRLIVTSRTNNKLLIKFLTQKQNKDNAKHKGELNTD